MVLLLTIVVAPQNNPGHLFHLVRSQEVDFINLYDSAILIEKFLWSKVGSVYYFPPRPMLPVMMSSMYLKMGLTRTLFCNRHKTKDVIFSIILGFTAIFTVLLLDGTTELMFV